MTGFGYSESEGGGLHLSAEITSLNARYLDLCVSLAHPFTVLENSIRKILSERFKRGRIEVNIRIASLSENTIFSVDEKAVMEWKKIIEKLKKMLEINAIISLDTIIRQQGVLKNESPLKPDDCWSILRPLLIHTIDKVLEQRSREGFQLHEDIVKQLNVIEDNLSAISMRKAEIHTEVEQSLKSRFKEIAGNAIDEQRMMMEIASWIAKMDINEEVVRLEAHLKAFREEIELEGGIGRRLDFLAQEMGREINTVSAKVPRADISLLVVNMKDALEKIREQLRNVE